MQGPEGLEIGPPYQSVQRDFPSHFEHVRPRVPLSDANVRTDLFGH